MSSNNKMDETICLTEQVDMTALQTIINNFDALKHHFEKEPEEHGEESKYDIDTLKGILVKYFKSKKKKGNDITYGFVGKIKDGRMFSKGECSLQSLKKIIRHTLARDIYYDIDMKNAHPTILSQYCEKSEIPCHMLDEYINDRDNVINTLIKVYPDVSFDAMKKLILTIINGGGGLEVSAMNDWLLKFYYEMKEVREQVCKKNPNLVKRARNRKEYNIEGAATNYLLCIIENEILQSIRAYCKTADIGIGVLVFDGIMIYKKHERGEYDVKEVCRKASDWVSLKTDWNIELVEKPMDKGLDLSEYSIEGVDEIIVYDDKYVLTPEEQENYVWTDFYMETREPRKSKSDLFNFFKTRFPYVCNKLNVGEGLYVKKETLENRINLVKARWGELYYYFDNESISVMKQKDLVENTCITTYSELCYKPKNDILNHQFNTWNKLKGDVDIVIETDITPLLNFMKEIICNNNENLYKYLISWLRQICKTPWNKTQSVLLFYSDQGTGKGSFVNWLIKYLFGTHNSTYASVNTITQKHNKILSNRVFIGVDELPTLEKQFHNLFDILKGLITEPYITIEPKGLEPYLIDNLCNFIFMTNNKNSIKIEKGDRRYVVFEINENKIGDFKYWDYMHKEVFTEQVANNFFKYLIDIDDDNEMVVNLREIPNTKIREEMKNMSLSNMELFIKDVRERTGLDGFDFVLYDAKTIRDNYGNDVLEKTDICTHDDYKDGQELIIRKKDFYRIYELWCQNNGEKASKMRYFNNHLEEVRKTISKKNSFGEIMKGDDGKDIVESGVRCYKV